MKELCESAKKGKPCINDLCRSNPDNTLCGFDQSFYDELVQESDDSDYDYYESDSTEVSS